MFSLITGTAALLLLPSLQNHAFQNYRSSWGKTWLEHLCAYTYELSAFCTCCYLFKEQSIYKHWIYTVVINSHFKDTAVVPSTTHCFRNRTSLLLRRNPSFIDVAAGCSINKTAEVYKKKDDYLYIFQASSLTPEITLVMMSQQKSKAIQKNAPEVHKALTCVACCRYVTWYIRFNTYVTHYPYMYS